MQKKLIAAAVAAAVTVPFAAAQADVKIYGKMDVSYNFIDEDRTAGNQDDFMDISSNSSRLGFKGSEDLGAGLKAIWQIETSVRIDATDQPFNRNTYVGLAGDWGQVRIGRHDTPFKIIGRKVDLFESEQLGENRILTSGRGVSAAGWDLRVPETIAYISPDFNGFQVLGAYMPEGSNLAGAGGVEDADAWSVAGLYGNGPLLVGLGYEVHGEGHFGAGADDESAWRLVGQYSFGDFKVNGLYQDVSDNNGVSGADWDLWGLGGQFDFGNNAVKLSYYDRDAVDGAADTGADFWSLGFDHNFSKRTKLYATYASVDNEANSTVSVNSNGFDSGGVSGIGSNLQGGGDSTGFSVGVRHKF